MGCSNGIMEMTAERVTQLIGPVLAQWPIERTWLYGSVARGEQHPGSDVDLSIEICKGGRIGLEVYHLQNQLEDALGVDVDVQTVPNRRMATRSFLSEYDRDKVLVYERAQQRRSADT